MITLTKKMLYFSTELKTNQSSNGSCINPIAYGKGWILPVGFMRTLSNEGITFEEVVITEEVDDPDEMPKGK